MRYAVVFVSLATLLLFGSGYPTFAQDNTIDFGDSVLGTLTDAEFEIAYSFTGEANAIVAIQMDQDGSEGGLEQPEVILLNASNKVIASTSDHFSSYSALLIMRLPADQEYTIIATRRDGRSGESVGKFVLTLTEPLVLTEGEPIADTVTSEGMEFYVIEGNLPFALDYTKTGGEFFPQVSINTLDEDYSLRSVASLEGEALIGGRLALRPRGSTLYIVQLDEALWDWNFEEVSATYTLQRLPSRLSYYRRG